MTLARPLGGIAAALCFCLVATASAAPRKPVKRRAAPAKHAPAGATPVQTAAVPSPTPAAGDVLLYDGRPVSAQDLTLTAFGGGTGEDSAEQSFAKGHSLKITTLDSYQGARLTFGNPIALGSLTDKTRYLDVTLRLSAIGSPAQQTGFPGGPGFPGRPGFPGGPGDGQDGGPTAGQYTVGGTTTVQNIHLILTLANGVKADVLRPLPINGDGQVGTDQWIDVAVPLSALGFPEGSASPLQSLMIAGDDYAVMYVGQIKIAQDDTPITAFAGDQQSVQAGQPFVLKGSAGGGLSTLHYGWTLDATDGTPDQASGPFITTQYLKTGDHTVTLTVSDVDGIKKPATATTIIHVQ